METVLKLLKQEGLEIKDERKFGLGFRIISHHSTKYVLAKYNSIGNRAGRFCIYTNPDMPYVLTVIQSQKLISELTKVTFLVKTINDAIDKGL